ncbi:MAG: 1-acyl-sn-glycerol-3-phosphate acyltransferase [Candidatus Krumholzibacteriia bacterium]|jgi:1-acyl-sn-glycerol-3-phosphate acyltransferase
MQTIRSFFFYVGIGVASLFLPVVMLVTLPCSTITRQKALAAWSGQIINMLRVFCRLDFQVSGSENIPAGPAIILCKHQSSWETFALQVVFPAQTWVLKRELLYIPFFGWGLMFARAIGIDRGSPKKALNQVINQGRDRLERGLWVVVFPEGTRSKPGTSLKYNAGGAMLASRTGYPVVPVAHNAGYFWNPGRFCITPGTIRITIGPTLESQGRRAGEINAESEQWIERAMDEIVP